MEQATQEQDKPRKLSQKNATFRALCLAKGINPDNQSEFSLKALDKSTISKKDRAQARATLFQMIRDEKVRCKRKYDDRELKKYVSGLISNWLSKDSRYFDGKLETELEETSNV
jgi:hypothetical protein